VTRASALCIASLLIVGFTCAGSDIRIGAMPFRSNAEVAPLPEYPAPAVRAGTQGLVVVRIRVAEDGNVLEVRTLESSGVAFAAAVNEALKQWHFRPFHSNGVPCSVISRLVFYFRIAGGRAQVIDATGEQLAADAKERRAKGPTGR
jgi:TonB family protein